jgi:hypothetical protein
MGAVAKGVRTGDPFWRGTKTRPLLAVWFTPHEWKSTMFLDTTGEHTRLATSDDKVETG